MHAGQTWHFGFGKTYASIDLELFWARPDLRENDTDSSFVEALSPKDAASTLN